MSFYYLRNSRLTLFEEYPTHLGADISVLCACLLFFYWGKSITGHFKITGVLSLFAWVAGVTIVSLTYSRGSILTLASLFPLLVASSYYWRGSDKGVWKKVGVYASSFLLVILLTPSGIERTSSMGDMTDGSITNRLLYWRYGTAMFLDFWHGGMTENHLSLIFNHVYAAPLEAETWKPGQYRIANLVNTPLTLCYRYGILGGCALIALYLTILWKCLHVGKNSLVARGLFGGLWAGFVSTFFLWIGQGVVLPWLILLLMLAGLITVILSRGDRGNLTSVMRKNTVSFLKGFLGLYIACCVVVTVASYAFKQTHPTAIKKVKQVDLKQEGIEGRKGFWYQISNRDAGLSSAPVSVILVDGQDALDCRKRVEKILKEEPRLYLGVLEDKTPHAIQLFFHRLREDLPNDTHLVIEAEGYQGNLVLCEVLKGGINAVALRLSDCDFDLGFPQSPNEIVSEMLTTKNSYENLPEITITGRRELNSYSKVTTQFFLDTYEKIRNNSPR